MADAKDETSAERSTRYASEYRETHKGLLENARTGEPEMLLHRLKLARLVELHAERYDEWAKEDAEVDRLRKLRDLHPHDESIRAELDNRPRVRINTLMKEMVKVYKMKIE